MSKDEILLKEYNLSLEDELCNIDENKLPEIISHRMELLEKSNKAFELAKERETRAREHVERALQHADEMIEKAKKLGEEKPEQHHFLKMSWSTKGDRIQCLEENLNILAKYGGDSADAQKELAEVQKALSDSQISVLEVQKTHMDYQELVAKTTKVLYGLCVLSMSSTQSIVTNLKAILSGAEKKELGEMAKQQMFLVMDQLKSQENILIKLKENDDYIAEIDEQVLQHEDKISTLEKENELLKQNDLFYEKQLKEEIDNGKKQNEALKRQQEKSEEHDRMIAEGIAKDQEQDKILQMQQAKDVEHDQFIAEGIAKDQEQDKILQIQQAKDVEHDQLICEGIAKDQEQDKILQMQQEKDVEHDQLIAEGIAKDQEQDKILQIQQEKDVEHDQLIAEGIVKDQEQDQLLRNQQEKDIEHDEMISKLKNNDIKQSEEIDNLLNQIKELEATLKKCSDSVPAKSVVYITTAISSVAIIMALIQFFI